MGKLQTPAKIDAANLFIKWEAVSGANVYILMVLDQQGHQIWPEKRITGSPGRFALRVRLTELGVPTVSKIVPGTYRIVVYAINTADPENPSDIGEHVFELSQRDADILNAEIFGESPQPVAEEAKTSSDPELEEVDRRFEGLRNEVRRIDAERRAAKRRPTPVTTPKPGTIPTPSTAIPASPVVPATAVPVTTATAPAVSTVTPVHTVRQTVAESRYTALGIVGLVVVGIVGVFATLAGIAGMITAIASLVIFAIHKTPATVVPAVIQGQKVLADSLMDINRQKMGMETAMDRNNLLLAQILMRTNAPNVTTITVSPIIVVSNSVAQSQTVTTTTQPVWDRRPDWYTAPQASTQQYSQRPAEFVGAVPYNERPYCPPVFTPICVSDIGGSFYTGGPGYGYGGAYRGGYGRGGGFGGGSMQLPNPLAIIKGIHNQHMSIITGHGSGGGGRHR